MKKFTPSLFLGLAFFFAILMILNFGTAVSAQSQADSKIAVQSESPIASTISNRLWLTGTQAYTTYMPLVITPPPPNPKKGVGAVASPACNDLGKLQGSWYSNWGIYPDPSCDPAELRKFVPRIFNAESMKWLTQAITNAKASGWLIGFSEPNLPWQGNLSPTQGAKLWKQIEDAALPAGIKLVSPSPNQWAPGVGNQQYGNQWTWAMVSEYQRFYQKKPHFDALGWNVYTQSPAILQDFLLSRRSEALARGYTVPFWILEYGGDCWLEGDKSGNQALMTRVTPEFNSTPWIQRYAWFANRITASTHNSAGWQSCSLINPDGTLTELGKSYSKY